MGVKIYKRTSAGRRNSSVNDFSEVTHRLENRPVKKLTERQRKTGGRNHHGVITARHRGGGHKRLYRIIDFRRNLDGQTGAVLEIQYDPNRSANIALIQYPSGEKRYILAPVGLKAGDTVESGEKVEPKVGNCMPLKNVPIGLEVHNIEFRPGGGGKLVRSAGGVARLMAREGEYAVLTLPSGEIRKVNVNCRATLGQIGNIDHYNVTWGKAGRSRRLGWRPTVRGKAMNPHDHPLGGGEGRSNGGRHPCSPWGQLAKGGRTRSPRSITSGLIIRRRWSPRYGIVSLKRNR